MEFDATFLFTALSFIIFVLIMNGIFYTPVLKIMKKRQDFVEQNYKSAQNLLSQADIKNRYVDEELEKHRNEARQKIAEQSKIFKEESRKNIADYRAKSQQNISDEKENLKRSATDAKDLLLRNVNEIAVDISSVILGSSVNTDMLADIDDDNFGKEIM